MCWKEIQVDDDEPTLRANEAKKLADNFINQHLKTIIHAIRYEAINGKYSLQVSSDSELHALLTTALVDKLQGLGYRVRQEVWFPYTTIIDWDCIDSEEAYND